MTQIQDIFDALCRIAPLELQMDFDNAGFQIGHREQAVRRVLLALDATDSVAHEAMELGCELIVTHHPLIFPQIRKINDSDPLQSRLLYIIENRIGLICMHTNLDLAEGGVNDVLIRLLGAEPTEALDDDGCGRIGTLKEPSPLDAFLKLCKERLQGQNLRYCTGDKLVYRLAVMGGSGAGSIERAVEKGCDTYVTSDIKYHQFQRAAELGLNLIDADHFYTENPIIPALAERLKECFPEVEFIVSQTHSACIRFA